MNLVLAECPIISGNEIEFWLSFEKLTFEFVYYRLINQVAIFVEHVLE